MTGERCKFCRGTGSYVVASTRGPYETDTLDCPQCSSSPSVRERAERVVAKAQYEFTWNGDPWEECDHETAADQRALARAVVSALSDAGLLKHEDEEPRP